MDFADARSRSNHVRSLYEKLERHHHGSEWTTSELVVGMVQDVGDLGRLVMASEGRWAHGTDVPAELGHELGEVLWWLFVLAERTGIDLEAAFDGFLGERVERLTAGVERPAALVLPPACRVTEERPESEDVSSGEEPGQGLGRF